MYNNYYTYTLPSRDLPFHRLPIDIPNYIKCTLTAHFR